MRKRITLSLSDNLLEKVRAAKDARDAPTSMSAMFDHIIIVWDQARKYKMFEKRKMKEAFWKAFDREVKAHPEWYVDDGPDFLEK